MNVRQQRPDHVEEMGLWQQSKEEDRIIRKKIEKMPAFELGKGVVVA